LFPLILYNSSSRGAAKNTGKTKPEVSAPGTDIYSAGSNGVEDYVTLDGTSMAAPHVTGAIALMFQADPDITFERILSALTGTAERPKPSKSDLKCERSKRRRNRYPNNAYEYGRINVRRAIEAL